MRIQIHAGHGPQARMAEVPPPLVQLTPNGELVLVELQGSLEMEGVDSKGGQTIGVLQFPAGREDRPILQISHHRLEGTLVQLRKPLAVLEKKVQPAEDEDEETIPEHTLRSSPQSPGAWQPSSPTPVRKRAKANEPPVTPVRSHAAPCSSSPMPERTVPLAERFPDFSSPQGPDPSGRWHKPATVTSYHVVTIVRKKLLFSKRPEPVVRLDGDVQ